MDGDSNLRFAKRKRKRQNSGFMEVQSNSNMNCSANKNKRKREKNKRNKALKAVNTDGGLQEVASETKTVPVDVSVKPVSEKDSCVEATAIISRNSGLIRVQSNSNLRVSENNNKSKRKKKRRKALEAVDLQEIASETKAAPFEIEATFDVSIKPVSEKDLCVEPTANISSNSGLIGVQSNSNLRVSENKNKRKEKKKRHKALEADNANVDLQEIASETKAAPFGIEAPFDVSIKPVSEKDLCVEPTANISSNSGLIGVQSNSNLRVSENKNKRTGKKKRRKALEADNTDVDLQEVASETKATPFGIEAPFDVSIKPVSETAPLEVEVPDDLRKKMDSVATSVETEAAVDTSTKMGPLTNMSHPMEKRMRRKKKKQNLSSLGHDDIDHVHPEDSSVTKNMVLEKDSSSLPPVNMCSEEQPNGHISLCLENNAVKELNDSENNSTAFFHLANGSKHYEKKDVKFDPEVAELDLTRVKEDLLVSEKQSNSSKIEDTSLLEKHDVHSENVKTSDRKKKVKTSSRKKSRESSDSGKNTSDCIKDDSIGFPSFGQSEEAHVTGLAENKLGIVLERKNDTSVQVLEDIITSIVCSDGKPVCKDNENKLKMKISKEDEENLEQINGDKLKEIKITVQEVSHANGTSDENSSSPKEKTSDSRNQEQTNAEVETKVEEIFSFSSQLGVTKNDVVVDDIGKENNLPQKSHPSIERACVGHCKKKLLVLDVNGLLADIVSYASCGYKPDTTIAKKAVFKRPYCDDFLRFCFERFNVGVWSSRIRRNVEAVVTFLMGDSRFNLLFTWDASHCSNTGLNTIENKNKPLVMKELKKLWDKLEPGLPWEKGEYNETNTLLLDDSPYKALRNPAHTAIFPYSYEHKDANDSSLGPGGDLRLYLEGLAAAENVQEYVRQNPFGQRAITESSPSWGFYSKIIDTKRSQPQDDSSTSSVANSNVVSRMSLECTSETGCKSQVTLHQAASETRQ
ncbi:hypothetical protein ACOSP7_026075 [Xanthoceras sorbifolium]